MDQAMDVMIAGVRDVARDIREFSLSRADGQAFPVFSAGSHVVLSLPLHERLQRNPYSLLGDPAQRAVWRIAVRRQEASRGGSAWLHEQAREGMRLRLSGPVNVFPLVRIARHHLLVAGGIGITPILSQARELARLGADFEVHYAWRGADQAAYRDEIDALAPGRVYHHDTSLDRHLSFDELLARQPLGTHLYICGPERMVKACMRSGTELGWPSSNLHCEQFLVPPPGEPFEVLLARSGKRLTVQGSLSLLETLEQHGIEVPSLCRGGACGQCETAVLAADGELLHHDLYLSKAERASGQKIMPCVSRFSGACLTLDL
jgi:ferredoxin-NADP reductase